MVDGIEWDGLIEEKDGDTQGPSRACALSADVMDSNFLMYNQPLVSCLWTNDTQAEGRPDNA